MEKVDTFCIEKWSANDHAHLSYTLLIWHLERKLKQFCNPGSVSYIMNKKNKSTKLTFDFQFALFFRQSSMDAL